MTIDFTPLTRRLLAAELVLLALVCACIWGPGADALQPLVAAL